MNWRRIAAAGIVATFTFAPLAKADPFDAQRVPADAKWLIHVDMDAAKTTKSWDAIDKKIQANDQWQTNLSQIETITGLKIPQDLHDVTVYGKTAGENAGVVILHAQLNRNQITTALQMNPDYASAAYGKYEILSWSDKGKQKFGAFHDDSMIAVGNSTEEVQAALDTIDAKNEAIKPDSALAAGGKKDVVVYIAARDVANLKKQDKAQSPLVQQIDTAWIALTEKDDKVDAKATVTAKTAEAATQMKQTLEGLRAFVGLAATSDNADANLKMLAKILPAMTCTQDGKTVNIDLPVSVDVISGLIDKLDITPKPDAAAN